jgi:hypothetical protein
VHQGCAGTTGAAGAEVRALAGESPVVFEAEPACRDREITYDGQTYRLFDPLFEGQPGTPPLPPEGLPVPAAPIGDSGSLPAGDLEVSIRGVNYAFGLDPDGIEINGVGVGVRPVQGTVVVKNNGPAAVGHSALYLTWDANAEYGEAGRQAEQERIVGGVAGADENLEGLGLPGFFALPPLAPGQEIVLSFEMPVITLENRTLKASVISNEIVEANLTNNTAQANGIQGLPAAAPPLPPAESELTVRLRVPNEPVRPGEEITVTVLISNTGQTPFSEVSMGLTTRTSQGTAGWIFGEPAGVRLQDSHTVADGLFDLAPGEQREYQVPITVQSGKPIRLAVSGTRADGTELEIYRSGVLPVEAP